MYGDGTALIGHRIAPGAVLVAHTRRSYHLARKYINHHSWAFISKLVVDGPKFGRNPP